MHRVWVGFIRWIFVFRRFFADAFFFFSSFFAFGHRFSWLRFRKRLRCLLALYCFFGMDIREEAIIPRLHFRAYHVSFQTLPYVCDQIQPGLSKSSKPFFNLFSPTMEHRTQPLKSFNSVHRSILAQNHLQSLPFPTTLLRLDRG